MDIASPSPLGISAITIHQPGWELENGWFGATMPRKFAHHTGIEARAISDDDEVEMAIAAVRKLQRETRCQLADCRGLVFVSPSFIPPAVARRHLRPDRLADERPGCAARRIVGALGVRRCRTIGLNWFCCGYSRALAVVSRRWAPRLALGDGGFLVVVVASRISRITDYSSGATAGLFGDMASATMLAPTTSRRHPVHFEILHADAERQPAERAAFDFHMRSEVVVPVPGGATSIEKERLVWSLDGMMIADIAPRAMSAATAKAIAAVGLAGDDVRFVVPHQAGAGIVRFTGMKLDDHGIRGELVNGLTRRTGNVSACSIPHALHETWSRLSGLVACPTAAVGSPGRAEVLQGCILLRSTPHHDRLSVMAA